MPLGDMVLNPQIRSRLSPGQFKAAFEDLRAYGHEKHNDFVDYIDAMCAPYEDEASDVASHFFITLLIPGEPHRMMLASPWTLEGVDANDDEVEKPRPFSRRITRSRLINHLRRKGMKRADAVAKVATLTDDQLDGAVGELPKMGIGDWAGGIWDFIKQNWPTILKVLLSLLGLLAFL